MAADNQNASELVLIDALRSLVPVNVLPADTFDSFAEHIQVETTTAGSELFHFGDSNNQVTYLLSGEVILKDHNNKFIQTIRGGTERARYPLAHELPREVTVKARTNVAYVQINMQELNKLMSNEYSLDHQIGDIRVRDIHDVQDEDWVTYALQSIVFENLPPANLQLLFSHFKSLPVKKGDIILNQGEVANYYYYICQGRCEVTKKTSLQGDTKIVAELKKGDAFGEEALIANTKRNATITMLSDGVLMRLSNTDFEDLIEKPLLKPLAPVEMEKHIEQGAQILDVREPADYELTHLAKSKNIPYQQFREAIGSLDPNLTYITYSNNGRRSAVAAFLLMQRGINALYLNERRQQSKYTLADTAPQHDSEPNVQELEKIKEAYTLLQLQLQKEQQLRKEAETKTIEYQNKEEESIKADNSEKTKQQTTSVNSEHLADDIKELKAEKEDIKRQLESYYSRIENEAEHLDNEVKAIQDLEATRVTALKEIEQLHADTTRAKQELEDAHRQAQNKAQQLNIEAEKLKNLNESRINEEKNLAELESRKLELEKMLSQRDDAHDELNALSVQLTKSKADIEQLHQQIQTETEQLSELKRQENQQKDILKNSELLKQRIEQLKQESVTAQSNTEQTQQKLKQQQTLLQEMETKAAEYNSLTEKQQTMQRELDSLTTQLDAAHQKMESIKRDNEENKLEAELSTLRAKEEAVQIKAKAEDVYLKAEEKAIQLKAEAEQARLAAQKEITQAKVKAEQIQLHAEAEVARIKSELAILQKQKSNIDNSTD